MGQRQYETGIFAMKHAGDLQTQIRGCLAALGISSPVDWDVLVFVYRHRASLASSEQIAGMLGFPVAPVVDSLKSLESLQLIRSSRAPRGVSLYQIVSFDASSPRHNCLRQLMSLGNDREGRLHITRKLRRSETEGTNA